MDNQGKNSLIYFLGRGIPGVINFVSISLFTACIAPSEYGEFAIAFAIISFFNTVFFSWIRLSCVRFYPAAVDNSELPAFYSSIGAGVFISTLFSSVIFLILLYSGIFEFENGTFPLVILVAIFSQGFFEIGQEYFVSVINPSRYSISFLTKAITNFLIGYALILWGFGGSGLLFSLVISLMIAVALFFLPLMKNIWISRSHFNYQFFKSFLTFGMPFTVSYGMVYIFNMLDRFFLDHYLGLNVTGIYSVSFDLSRQTLWIFFTSISLAGFPLALKLFQNQGKHEGLLQMEKNFVLLTAVCAPISLGLSFLAKDFSEVFVGDSYRQGVQNLIPILSIGTLILGVKNFYFDQSFQISKRTYLQLIPVVFAAITSILLNMFLIPRIGVNGAAYSSLISFIVGLILSVWLSQITFPLPIPFLKLGKILIANALMLLVLYFVSLFLSGMPSLILSFIAGSVIYFSALQITGVLNFKELVFHFLKRRS